MGLIIIDCGDSNDENVRMTCLSTRIWFSIDIILLALILYQIRLRIKKTQKKFSRKLIILYLLLIEPFGTFHFDKKFLILSSKWDL